MVNKKLQGKQNLEKGRRFETKTRKELENKEWIVSRWGNNVDLKEKKLIPARQGRFRKTSTGFPDFIAFRELVMKSYNPYWYELIKYDIIGIECRSSGYLTKEEKAKCKWLLDNRIFNRILIASKGKKRGEIEHKEFK